MFVPFLKSLKFDRGSFSYRMGWFGSSEGSSNSSSGIDLSGGSSGDYSSKLRSPSSELDLSDFSTDPSALASGDIQMQIQKEQQKALLMSAIHKITDVCWDICVDSVGSSLSRRSESCLSNCSERFVDTTLFVTNRLAQLASKMGGGR